MTTQRPNGGPPILKPGEIKALVNAPDGRTRTGRKHAALLAVLVGGGLRLTEARSLKGENVEREDGRLRLTFQTIKQKREAWRTVTLPEWAARLLSRYMLHTQPKDGDWLFPGHRGECMSVSGVERVVSMYLAIIGRNGSDGRPALRPHSLRHTFGALVVKKTQNLFAAQRLLGHSSPAVTSRYYATWLTDEADAVADTLTKALRKRRKVAA